ncbi:uncharacterized protein LOC107493895 [Arachis duranensis]|uniref:Uncharacterized protein LOC107493895 n=1 Tax=Arachis duranensis TaxID=130453 RepID=A0A6P4DWR3_ARADU|nr:uncharacterized protein LOC107493895 [Arachis duranensis]
MELTVKEALALPLGKKIVLNHNRELQQVGQAAGLLSGFLGTLSSDFQQLPIGEKSWKTMSKASKEHAFDQFKRVFHYEDDGRGIIKRGIVQRIGNSWRNARNHLFHKEKCKKNAANRSKQMYTHTGGSKTMGRKRHEEELRQGRPIGRGEGWTMSHKKKRMEAIEHIESQDPSSKEFSHNDSLAQSDYCVQIEEYQMEIEKLKAEAAELNVESAELKVAAEEEKAKRQRMKAEGKAKMQSMGNLLSYIIQQQGGSLPPEIAADLDSLRSNTIEWKNRLTTAAIVKQSYYNNFEADITAAKLNRCKILFSSSCSSGCY